MYLFYHLLKFKNHIFIQDTSAEIFSGASDRKHRTCVLYTIYFINNIFFFFYVSLCLYIYKKNYMSGKFLLLYVKTTCCMSINL